MAEKLTVEEQPYGAKVQQEEAEVAGKVAEGVAATKDAEVQALMPQPPAENPFGQGVTPSLMNMVPPGILFRPEGRPDPMTQRFNIADMWDVLADDEQVDPIVQSIAARLRGE